MKGIKMIVIALLSSGIFSCHTGDGKAQQADVKDSDSTTIIINLKKAEDRQYTLPLTQLNPLYFEPVFVAPPPNHVDTSNPLKVAVKLAISEPAYMAIGLNVCYVEPGDSVNIDFKTIVANKTQYMDTMAILHGNVFFLSMPQRSKLFDGYVRSCFGMIRVLKDAKSLSNYFTGEKLLVMLDSCYRLVYKDFPNLKSDEATRERVRVSSGNRFYIHMLGVMEYYYHDINDTALKVAMEAVADSMMILALKNVDPFFDPTTWGKYLALFRFYKGAKPDATYIESKFDKFGDTVKQYIALNLLKDGLLKEPADEEAVVSRLTYPPFRQVAKTVLATSNRGIEKSGYINNVIRNVEIFDANDKKMVLSDLFKTSTQPYLIFDFCGTWCAPCMEAIAVYSKVKPLDNSKKIRPIWLFFENDKSKWLSAVEKYGLKRENCFVILRESGATLTKEFETLFDWEGEFPHHFVFSSDGRIVDKRAVNLAVYQENRLADTAPAQGVPPVAPPPPVGAK
ncbi:hypothetical protein MKQ68_11535 [Chitinophaga horti]|uniref:Thioredoxin domain-containing protein n=1 Tax=Chitinophaga horti TaxID=2920382 RepID=A0ABY6J7T1_9BACT|nr:hypothetical protein [Chitinophaga horti]UYQ95734.1 hypothetical protein MKQ68_11535 [Chitinophaga horti]